MADSRLDKAWSAVSMERHASDTGRRCRLHLVTVDLRLSSN